MKDLYEQDLKEVEPFTNLYIRKKNLKNFKEQFFLKNCSLAKVVLTYFSNFCLLAQVIIIVRDIFFWG